MNRRTSVIPLLAASTVALAAACSSGSTSVTSAPAPSSSPADRKGCSTTPTTGKKPTAANEVLCVGTAGVAELGRYGGIVRITVDSIAQAPPTALAALDLGADNNVKKSSALWYVRVSATILVYNAGPGFAGIDPADPVGLRYAGGTGVRYQARTAAVGCADVKFGNANVGDTTTSCVWSVLPAGAQPTEVAYFGTGDTTPSNRWRPRL